MPGPADGPVSPGSPPSPVAAGDRGGRALATARAIADHIGARARWRGPACTWEAGGSEIDGRLAGGSAGIALFLVRLSAATGDGAYLHPARGALAHALAREGAEGAAHGWYDGTAGVAATCAALGVASGDPRWLDAAVSLGHAVGGLEGPAPVHDVAGGEAGSVLGLLAVHGATEDARVLAAARRMGDALLAKRRREPEGISWNGRHAAVRNLLGLAHGAGGIGLALLELFRATGEERYFAGASEALRYEDAFHDGVAGDWPDLRHPALAAHLDSGGLRDLREAVAADAFDLATDPRPGADWRYGTPGIALVRARFFEITGLERHRTALDRAAAPCRARVLAAARGEPMHGDALLAAADVLLERARLTGDGHDGRMASDAAVPPWDGEPFSPALVGGAAGIGFFHLRLASPRVPSPLLPGPGSPASTLSSVSEKDVERAALAGALEHFPRTERALAAAGIRVQVIAMEGSISTAAVRDRLGELVAALPAGERARTGEALALETLAYEQARAHAGRAEGLVRSLTRSHPDRLDHADARVRLAPSARLVRASYDWEPLLDGGAAPRHAPGVYLVHDTPGGYALRRLDDLGARLFSPLEAATSVGELVEEVAADLDTDARGDEVRARLRGALRGAYERGIVEMVDPHGLRPSDVTSALCTRCGECCRVRIYIPGDAAYAEFIGAVMGAPLRAAYPDLAIRHERAGGREHVVLDLGYCHHLERGTDDGGHPTFRCGIYEGRPEVCRGFNCVAWGRLQAMGSPARTTSDAALERVAALKRALEGGAGA